MKIVDAAAKDRYQLSGEKLDAYCHVVDEALDELYKDIPQTSIEEMAYPSSFNMEEFKSLSTFKSRIQYCQSRLVRIAAGSSRIAYRVDNEKVLKLAMNTKGLAQNEAEGGDYYIQTLDIFAKVFDVDEKFRWIEMESAIKAKPSDFKRLTGYDFNFICGFIDYVYTWYSPIRKYRDDSLDEKYKEISNDSYNYGTIFGDLIDYMTNFQIKGVGDLKRISSWGIVIRDGEETLVLIDFGLNNQVGEKYYGIRENVGNSISKGDIMASFEPQKKLHPKIWPNEFINSRVRLRLLDIADDFIDTLNVKWVKPKDIILTGSLANYNWSKYSDFDLHILMNFKEVDDRVEFVKDYFDSKKKIWNEQHEDLKIYGFPVEVYVQDINEEHKASGIYSLYKNHWIHRPSRDNIKSLGEDRELIRSKSIKCMKLIDRLAAECEHDKDEYELGKLSKKVKKTFDKIKGIRKTALKYDGEMSAGNIFFKVLRRTGYLQKLIELKAKTYDKLYSLN